MASTGTTTAKSSNLKFMMRALGSPNYRLFFGGQSISLIGSWMTRFATLWLIFRLTHSDLLLGVVGFAGQLPSFLLAPYAGVMVDRLNKRPLLVITQALAMVQSLALAYLTLKNIITINELLALSAFQGLINAFDMPGRQAFLVEMVENKADLGNAIALNSSMVNGARLLGPSIGGLIVAASSEGWCFFIDGVSYLAVIASLLLMVIAPHATGLRKTRRNTFTELRDGWSYVSTFAPIRNVLLLLTLISLVGVPYSVLMPIFANNLRPGDPNVLGWLMAASGVGALIGALTLAARRSVLGLGRVIPMASATFGIGLILFSLSHWLWLSLALMTVTGFGFMMQMASSNTLLQTIVEDNKRGRVMSFYTMSFMGTAPFGSLLAGWMSARIGAPHTVFCGGLGCLFGALCFVRGLPAVREAIRPIYRQMGILPEVTAGINEAAELSVPPED